LDKKSEEVEEEGFNALAAASLVSCRLRERPPEEANVPEAGRVKKISWKGACRRWAKRHEKTLY